jgi:hypothetical protein
MEVVGILRQLWHRRLLVCLGVVLALAAATLMALRVDPGGSPMFQSRQYDVGVATASVLVDSQSSQVVDLGGGSAQDGTQSADITSLSTRARLLATLMATSPLKDRIAEGAEIPTEQLLGVPPKTGPTATSPEAETPLASETRVDPEDPEANILGLYVAEDVPIITLSAQAPSAAMAERIARSAVTELTNYPKSAAADNRVPDGRQLVVAPLGPPVSASETRGPRHLFSMGAFLLVLTLWCAGILVVGAVARGWRQAVASENAPSEGGPASPPDGVASGPPAAVPPAAEPRAASQSPAEPEAVVPVAWTESSSSRWTESPSSRPTTMA